jgi:hypothetical protein
MGRRKTIPADPRDLRRLVATISDAAATKAGVNLARWRAQLVEEEMVATLVDFVRDITLTPNFRRECAKDILELARGKIAPQMHDGETINPAEPTSDGSTVGAYIESQRVEATKWMLLDQYVGKVPVAQWPESVRLAAGDLVSVYSEDEQS